MKIPVSLNGINTLANLSIQSAKYGQNEESRREAE
jgi:hypothetical protein